jgi:hypothetical protein
MSSFFLFQGNKNTMILFFFFGVVRFD